MELTEQLRAWGAAHAQARKAQEAAHDIGDPGRSSELRREATSWRERADRLHREIYERLGRRKGDGPH